MRHRHLFIIPFDGQQSQGKLEGFSFRSQPFTGNNTTPAKIHLWSNSWRASPEDIIFYEAEPENDGGKTREYYRLAGGPSRPTPGGVATDGLTDTLLYRGTEAEAFRPMARTNFKDALDPLDFTSDAQVSPRRGDAWLNRMPFTAYRPFSTGGACPAAGFCLANFFHLLALDFSDHKCAILPSPN